MREKKKKRKEEKDVSHTAQTHTDTVSGSDEDRASDADTLSAAVAPSIDLYTAIQVGIDFVCVPTLFFLVIVLFPTDAKLLLCCV